MKRREQSQSEIYTELIRTLCRGWIAAETELTERRIAMFQRFLADRKAKAEHVGYDG